MVMDPTDLAAAIDVPPRLGREVVSLRRDVGCAAMGLLEIVRLLASGEVGDVVGIRHTIKTGKMPHAIGDCMIGAGRVTTDPKAADDLAA